MYIFSENDCFFFLKKNYYVPFWKKVSAEKEQYEKGFKYTVYWCLVWNDDF